MARETQWTSPQLYANRSVGFLQDRAEFWTLANPSAASQDQREISLSDPTVQLEITDLHSGPAQIFSTLGNFQGWHTHTHTSTHTHTPHTHIPHTHTTHTQTHTHTHYTHTPHTHHKATCCTLTPPNPLQTVPHATHTKRHRLKINGVMFFSWNLRNVFKTV